MAEKKNRYGRKFRLVDDPDESWREFGRSDPYFGVLSTDRFRAGNLDQAGLREFFATGEAHIQDVLETLERHVGPVVYAGEALDFGCGVGRLVLPLARRFAAVTGVDISEAYIAEASRNAAREGLSNVSFAPDLDSLKGRQFDLIHTYIVFNHIPWRRGKELIGQLYGLLKENGVMALHVLHRRRAGPARRVVSWARRNFLPLHGLINVLRGRPFFEPLMQGNEYRLDELLPWLNGLGVRGLHVRTEPAQDGDSFAFLFFAKGPPPSP